MLIVALVLAVIGLGALVTAVVTSNELVAWVCIAASVIGVILLIVDAIKERQKAGADQAETAEAVEDAEVSADTVDQTYQTFDADYPDDAVAAEPTGEVAEAIETEDASGDAKPNSA